jgi:hypothetical protein
VKNLVSLIGIAVLFFGCDNNSTDDLIDATIVENATYTEHIKPIIDFNCTGCHATVPQGGAPMPLVSYDHVKEAVLQRGLLNRISRAQGQEGMMPNGGTRLPQHQIDVIAQWAEQGFQE